MTRLLRVNKQIHDEAKVALYRDFTIRWPQWACAYSIPVFLSKLSPRFKELVGNIIVRLHVDAHYHDGNCIWQPLKGMSQLSSYYLRRRRMLQL
jgi:hypothetical protein